MPDLSASFDWFAQPPEERSPAAGAVIKEQLLQIWEEVRSRIGPDDFDAVLGDLWAGKRSSRVDGAWVQTNRERDHNFVNMTIEMDPDALSLNVVGWFDNQLQKVEAWLRQPRAWRFLNDMPDWLLVIFIRHANIAKDGKAVFQGATGLELERLAFSETSAANLSTRLTAIRPRLDSEREKISLHLRRPWTAAECAAIDDIAAAIAPEVERWLQPIQEIRVA
jgi:hypothetical protein